MKRLEKYLHDRLRTLRPSPSEDELVYPWVLFGKLSRRQWAQFMLGYLAWSWDAFDFHSVTLSYPDLIVEFDTTLERLSLAVTLTLMTRPLGGAIFGILSDRYGRTYPFIANCVLLIVFVLITGFCETYGQFVAVRALFGCAMGGIYGNAAATALEDCPPESRGIMSGIYQSGYPMGYVLAVIFYKAFHDTPHHWRALFWFGSAVPILLIIYRLRLDETEAWDARERFRSHHASMKEVGDEVCTALKRHWRRMLYLVLLLMGLMYLSHGTQDIYPYLLRYKYRHLPSSSAIINKITTIQTVASLGGVTGGMVTGYSSQILGRRFAIMLACLIGGSLLYPYVFTTNDSIHAAAFFIQFCVQGAWSVVPIHLIELSPVGFRTFFVGTSYQMASFVASGSNTILVRIASRFPGEVDENADVGGKRSDDFSVPIAAFAGCAFMYVIVMAALGPERRGRDMVRENEKEEGGGRDGFKGIKATPKDMPQAGP